MSHFVSFVSSVTDIDIDTVTDTVTVTGTDIDTERTHELTS